MKMFRHPNWQNVLAFFTKIEREDIVYDVRLVNQAVIYSHHVEDSLNTQNSF